ncbi:DNA/RNA non-specific endonuclease [Mucilaginibacter gracilis]|uniref:DNA/RNA non-specific endonuclease n=1 Tax=Mucilaginibacter gracilis TaxID=423350 RepID=A0A495J575_9SPHI|nr:DNA/RNA non-specific endonuclease [Mucilaginibacter gracilis]RKR84130.1 DNA/RNA non-specific endonuclease [Mucilaginibacter gracilis]
MNKIITMLLCIYSTYCYSQGAATDTVTINQGNFKVTWSHSAKYPVKVVWKLTKEMLSCSQPLKRCNCFQADPQLAQESNLTADYAHSGYDQGHNFNAADDACASSQVNVKCWYFTNMTPQLPHLNRITWKNLEDQCRNWVKGGDELVIECGSYGCVKKIGPDNVWVPAYCWKIIRHKNGVVDSFLMPNTDDVNAHDYFYYHTDITVIRQKTGIPTL